MGQTMVCRSSPFSNGNQLRILEACKQGVKVVVFSPSESLGIQRDTALSMKALFPVIADRKSRAWV